MTTPLLTDSKGVKIGKTEGNVIALTDKPEELFGKIMALPDDVIVKGFEYLTDVPMDEIKRMGERLNKKENPVEFKKKMAFEIVKELNNEDAAQKAQEIFEQTVQGEKLPDDIPVFQYKEGDIFNLLVQSKLAGSRSDAKRLVEQGGVSIDDKIISANEQTDIKENSIIRVGKRKFVKIKISG